MHNEFNDYPVFDDQCSSIATVISQLQSITIPLFSKKTDTIGHDRHIHVSQLPRLLYESKVMTWSGTMISCF